MLLIANISVMTLYKTHAKWCTYIILFNQVLQGLNNSPIVSYWYLVLGRASSLIQVHLMSGLHVSTLLFSVTSSRPSLTEMKTAQQGTWNPVAKIF